MLTQDCGNICLINEEVSRRHVVHTSSTRLLNLESVQVSEAFEYLQENETEQCFSVRAHSQLITQYSRWQIGAFAHQAP